MSADSESERPRRRPLSRSRKLGSRRRRSRRGSEDEEKSDEEETDTEEAAADSSEPDAADDEPAEQTRAVSRLPSPEGSGVPDLSSVPPPPAAEQWARIKGAVRRFRVDFTNYLVGLGQSAHQQGVDFGQKVVKPFSHALFEAAICVVLLFVCGVFGVMFGGYIKTVTAEGGQTVNLQNREVRPGQQIDESFFSQGFDTTELHKRANRILEKHLNALKASELVDAYDLLSPAWKAQLSYPTFEQGYLSTRVVGYQIGRAETLDPRRVRIRANLLVEEQGQEKSYNAVYIAVLTAEGWRLDGGTFN